MIGIYKIENKINGKVYIGQSRNINRRWHEELNGQVNDYLKKSFNKYGVKNFLFSVICECKEPKLNELEKRYIQEHKSYIKKNGYNLTLGGNGGNWLDEAKERASIRMTGKGNSFYGKHHTEETKQKISMGRIGKKHWHYGGRNSPETKAKQSITKLGGLNSMAKKVYQYTLDGKLLNSFKSVSIASQETKIGYSAIKNCSGGISKTAGGYSWEYGEYVKRHWGDIRLKKVICTDNGMKFESLSSASRFFKSTPSEIKRVCDGERRTAKKHKFSYI